MKEKANYHKNKNKIELFLAFWRKAKIRTCKQLKIAMIPWNFSFAGHPVVLPILGWATTARVPGMHSDTRFLSFKLQRISSTTRFSWPEKIRVYLHCQKIVECSLCILGVHQPFYASQWQTWPSGGSDGRRTGIAQTNWSNAKSISITNLLHVHTHSFRTCNSIMTLSISVCCT